MPRRTDLTLRRCGREPAEHGYATVWAVGWMACCLAVGWLVLLAAVGAARQHHLDGAADLTALSAAHAVEEGSDGCEAARRIAAANHVGLADCVVSGADVTVTVVDRLDLPLDLELTVVGRARAGPA